MRLPRLELGRLATIEPKSIGSANFPIDAESRDETVPKEIRYYWISFEVVFNYIHIIQGYLIQTRSLLCCFSIARIATALSLLRFLSILVIYQNRVDIIRFRHIHRDMKFFAANRAAVFSGPIIPIKSLSFQIIC